MKKESKKSSKRKLSIVEIVLYSLSGALGLWGFVYVILGIAAKYTRSDTEFYKFVINYKDTFKLDVLYWGMILMGIAAVFASIVLLINAKKSDREFEKQSRRAARLAGLSEKKNAEEEKVVDVKVEEKEPEAEQPVEAEPVKEAEPVEEEAAPVEENEPAEEAAPEAEAE